MVEYRYYPLTADINYQPVICVEGFITQDDLNRINEQLKTIETTAALIGRNTARDEVEYERMRLEAHKTRKSNISFLSIQDWNWLYAKVAKAVVHANVTNYNKTLYGISPLQYSEYDSNYNGFYAPHVDYFPNIIDGLKRSLSFSLQLTDSESYEGGEVKVYHEDQVYISNKKLGSITFFDSASFHEVTPVTSGFRKSLVGWVLGPRV